MRLVRRLTIALLASFALLFAGRAWLAVREFIEMFETDAARDDRTMGRALAAAAGAVWKEDGHRSALSMIEAANDPDSATRIRFVDPGAPPTSPKAPALPGAAEAVLAGHELTRRERGHEEHGLLYVYTPMRVDGAVVGALEITESLADEARYIRIHIFETFVATGALVIVSGGLAWVIGMRFVGRPVNQLMDHARRIGAGDLSGRVDLRTRDELAELATEMNAMTEQLSASFARVEAETTARIAANDALRHADRLTTVGRLASGIAHELGTPLNVVSGRAQMIATGEISAGDAPAAARIIREQADRMVRILRQLLDFARRRGPERVATDLTKLVHAAGALLQPLADRQRVHVECRQTPDRFEAAVDPDQLHQVIVNVVMNAVQASPPDAEVQVRLTRRCIVPSGERDAAPVACICIEVEDVGPGMTDEICAHVFEPFFTTKPVGAGTGLGLSVAYGIMRDHGGWIDVRTERGRGSCFTVCLPETA